MTKIYTNKNLMQRPPDDKASRKSNTKPEICKLCKKAGKPFVKTHQVGRTRSIVILDDESGEHLLYRSPTDPALQKEGSMYVPRPVRVYENLGLKIAVWKYCPHCKKPYAIKCVDVVFDEDMPNG